ncbi:ER membrane protein DP1/Yop1 [Dimargaris verticillata]|uniref:Protein YOP1 n=1 Tax=Dimargaris verticillata TaxID=2761393 RepID=A0A9W8EBN9_9FUNG|nr:ER membrane protein DP1/Yop1 [Dimargaris verticillata]
MEQLRRYHDQYYGQANRELSKIHTMNALERKTGVSKVYASCGIALVGLILVFFNIGGNLITNLIGFVYPAWSSFHAIESPGKDDDTQWLTYWTVFGLFNTAEYFSNVLLYWIPFYYVFKLVVLMWLLLPQTRGAEYVYQQYLRPVFLHRATGARLSPTEMAQSARDRAAETVENLKAHAS